MSERPDAELNLDAVVNVRVTSAEKEALREQAATLGTSVSDLVRRRSLGLPVVSQSDEQVVRDLRRLGGLLKAMYAQHGAFAPEVRRLANAIAAFLARQIDRNRRS